MKKFSILATAASAMVTVALSFALVACGDDSTTGPEAPISGGESSSDMNLSSGGDNPASSGGAAVNSSGDDVGYSSSIVSAPESSSDVMPESSSAIVPESSSDVVPESSNNVVSSSVTTPESSSAVQDISSSADYVEAKFLSRGDCRGNSVAPTRRASESGLPYADLILDAESPKVVIYDVEDYCEIEASLSQELKGDTLVVKYVDIVNMSRCTCKFNQHTFIVDNANTYTKYFKFNEVVYDLQPIVGN